MSEEQPSPKGHSFIKGAPSEHVPCALLSVLEMQTWVSWLYLQASSQSGVSDAEGRTLLSIWRDIRIGTV